MPPSMAETLGRSKANSYDRNGHAPAASSMARHRVQHPDNSSARYSVTGPQARCGRAPLLVDDAQFRDIHESSLPVRHGTDQAGLIMSRA